MDFPKVDSGRPVTGTDKAHLIEDEGGSGASVVCNWRPSSVEGYFVSFAMTLRSANGESRFASWSGTFIEGEVTTANITFDSPEDSIPQYGGDGTCMFTVVELDPIGRSIWGSFTCETLTTLDDTDTCAVGPSYFAMENCEPIE